MTAHAMILPAVALPAVALGAMVAGAAAQTTPTPESWVPTSRIAQSVTGRVTFAALQITFQNGKSLALAAGGQMIFRPEKQQKVMADLYLVTPPEDPVLENGNTICKGKGIAYLLVWKSQRIGREADPRTMAAFSGKSFAVGSHDECGRFVYDAGGR
jgi:hypothetical protein